MSSVAYGRNARLGDGVFYAVSVCDSLGCSR